MATNEGAWTMFKVGATVRIKEGRRMNAGKIGTVIDISFEGALVSFDGDVTRYFYWELKDA
jgi:hypothetical protein